MTGPIQTAEIIAVGSELLTPHRVDTNSLWLTAELNALGIAVLAKHVARDDLDQLSAMVVSAAARAHLVILTGGLGPTHDDLTREAVASALGLPLSEDPSVLEAIRARFERRGMRMAALNRRQALVPRGGVVLTNSVGTAPGVWVASSGAVVVLLPGPPRELRPMFEQQVRARLEPRVGRERARHREIRLTGRSESQVAELLQPILAELTGFLPPVEATILASPGRVEIHLSASGAVTDEADRSLDSAVARMVEALGDAVFSVDGQSLESVVGRLLVDRGWQVACAESCTGGRLLGRLTDVAGSSGWVLGGIVAYADDVKVEHLAVAREVIAQHGAVSEPVAAAMAAGVRGRLQADIAIAITGIAGPSGGTAAKPVGTVVIAVDGPEGLVVRTFSFPGDREMVREFSVAAALNMLRQAVRQ